MLADFVCENVGEIKWWKIVLVMFENSVQHTVIALNFAWDLFRE